MFAIPGSGGFSVLLMQKQEKYKAATIEQEYGEKQNRSRILIVDDDPDITLTLKKALRDNGFEQVDTVNEPLLALKNLKEQNTTRINLTFYLNSESNRSPY